MFKKILAYAMEWVRPIGISLAFFIAYTWGHDAVSRFHILGPLVVVIMSGSVAIESFFLGEISSRKIGYVPNRAYQIQSGLANAAIALTAVLVVVLGWGRFAEATIVSVMLLFFVLSGANHFAQAYLEGNRKPVNLLRPVMAVVLVCFMLPPMIHALMQ